MAKHPIRKFQRLTTGDDAFRAKFRSWDMTELSYVDIREYLKEKDTVLVPMASTSWVCLGFQDEVRHLSGVFGMMQNSSRIKFKFNAATRVTPAQLESSNN